jgi:hypothetical protein
MSAHRSWDFPIRKEEIGNKVKSLKGALGALGAPIGPFDCGKDCLELDSI